MSFTELLFWFSALALVYIYAGYPVLVNLCGRLKGRPVRKGDWNGSVSVILVAYNEAGRMTGRLDNLLQLQKSELIREILVGSDGSTDSTAALATAYPDPRVQGFAFPERRGKPGVINDLVARATGDVLLFVDARQELESETLVRLLENFADPQIGVVSGELVFRQDSSSGTAAEGVGFYWTYEKLIRTAEGRFRSVPGATGAIYAMRRDAFRPIPASTLLDDVVIPMQAVEQGYRCILERGAIAWDTPSVSSGKESIRKRRTIAGCAQLLTAQPRWLLPWKNPIWWEFISHKVLRLASPLFLVLVGVTNLILAGRPWYLVLLTLQLSLYVTALCGWWFQKTGAKSKLFGPSLMFVSLNTTTVMALCDALRGRFRATWQKTA